MPIHDWTRVSNAAFHDFQLGWSVRLSTGLNSGLLPGSHFSMTETVELRPPADFSPLSEPDESVLRRDWDDALPYATENPPPTVFRMADDRRQYACRVVTVRDDLRQPVAAVLFVTRQDKETAYRMDAITRLAVGAVTRGIHLLTSTCFRQRSATRKGATNSFGIGSRTSRSSSRLISR